MQIVIVTMPLDPLTNSEDFVEGNGQSVLWRKRVVNADHCSAGVLAEQSHHAIVRIEISEHPPAAMQINQGG